VFLSYATEEIAVPEGGPVIAATYVRVIACGAVNEALSTP